MTLPMRHWGPARMQRHLASVAAEIEPPHPREVAFCPCCGEDLEAFVYSGWLDGLMRWPYLCSECAAEWVNLGGRIALRWTR